MYGSTEMMLDEGHMVALPDREARPVMSFRDLLEIIDTCCGQDVRNLICGAFRDLIKEKEELDIEIEDYRRTLECNEEEERELLLSINDEVEALLNAVADTRLNRRKMQRIAKNIYEIVDGEL